jgi:hypothetical protein
MRKISKEKRPHAKRPPPLSKRELTVQNFSNLDLPFFKTQPLQILHCNARVGGNYHWSPSTSFATFELVIKYLLEW